MKKVCSNNRSISKKISKISYNPSYLKWLCPSYPSIVATKIGNVVSIGEKPSSSKSDDPSLNK